MWWMLACREPTAPGPTGTGTDGGTTDRATDTGDSGPEPTTEPPPEEPLSCEEPRVDGTSLCLTEVQSANRSTYSRSPGDFPDWIELANRGTRTLSAAEISLRIGDDVVGLDPTEPPLFPGEVRVWIADGEAGPGHLDAKLDAGGESIAVWTGVHPADAWEVPALGDDLAFHRSAAGAVEVTCTPSPGAPNGATTPCEDVREVVYGLGRVWDFALTIDDENQRILSTSDLWFHPDARASLAFSTPDGTWAEFPDVAVSLKGGYGSFRSDLANQKIALKIDVNRYDDHRWRGGEKVVLNNAVQDPTFTHEHLTNLLFRESGVPASRIGFANLTINGTFVGFYVLVEAVDDTFCEDWYGDGSGHLLEAAYGPDFDLGDEPGFGYDEGPDAVAGRALVTEVATLLATQPWDEATYATLRTLVDMDEWMANMAVEAATWHWDGYWTENNYYVYEDPATGLLSIVPHGTDQTWVGGWPNAWDGNGQSALYAFCLAVPSCAAMYGEKVLDVADTIDRLALEAELDAAVAATEAGFQSDLRGEWRDGRGGLIEVTRERIRTVSQNLRDLAAQHGVTR